jgi:hypothetical protein
VERSKHHGLRSSDGFANLSKFIEMQIPSCVAARDMSVELGAQTGAPSGVNAIRPLAAMVLGLTRQTTPRLLKWQAAPTDQDLLRVGNCQIHNCCRVTSAGVDVARSAAPDRPGWKVFQEILELVRNNGAGSCVAFPQVLPVASGYSFLRHPDLTIGIVPGPALLRCQCIRNSIDREPNAGRAEEMTYEALLCSFLPSIAR